MGNEGIKPHRLLAAKDIAAFLNAPLNGLDCGVTSVASLDEVCENSLTFSKGRLTEAIVAKMQNVCVITSELPEETGHNAFILVDNPRLAFAKVLQEFFVERNKPGIGQYTVIDPSAKIGKNVVIGNGCSIGRNVVIGDYSEIRNNVIISDNVKIGNYCLIRSCCVIGEEGFGFDNEEDGTPIRVPHIGGVEIGDYVEIGNFTAVARGTLKDTVIGSNVKIDNLVHIAHNCIIGKNTMIIACAEISGSSVVGVNCWLGVGCTTMQKIKIGDNSIIGIGSVVLQDVPSNSVMAGNPARVIRVQDSQF